MKQQVDIIKQKTQAFVKSLELKMSFVMKLEEMPAPKKESHFREVEQFVARNDAELTQLNSQIERYGDMVKGILAFKPCQKIVKTHKYKP